MRVDGSNLPPLSSFVGFHPSSFAWPGGGGGRRPGCATYASLRRTRRAVAPEKEKVKQYEFDAGRLLGTAERDPGWEREYGAN